MKVRKKRSSFAASQRLRKMCGQVRFRAGGYEARGPPPVVCDGEGQGVNQNQGAGGRAAQAGGTRHEKK